MGKHNQKKKSKTSNASLGKTLINNMNKRTTKKNYVSELHRFEDRKKDHTNLMSILEQDSLAEFADLVSLSNKKIEVEKRVNLMEQTEITKAPHLAIFKSMLEQGISRPKYAPLKLPRKPHWTKEMTKDEVIANENHAFLEWRRDIATMEEGNVNLAITPFEKNLSVWKQLWNVIERSQLLIQIVDCRNPFFFYSADLERYIKELDQSKHYLLLLNKADYLKEEQISHWNEYFKEKGVDHVFFSALYEEAKIAKLEEKESEVKADIPPNKDSMLDEVRESIKEEEEQNKENEIISKMVEEEKLSLKDNCKIYSREELLRLVRVFLRQNCTTEHSKDGRYTVGMVGYPNVGKSSIINVLCGAKKVGVAPRPGKTKHLQTILLGSDICLCDCPGLVFPSFASSKSEMVCCGVIPIDNLKDIISPMELITKRIPREMFEKVYKIKLPEKFNASELLQAFSGTYGYVTGRALPDEGKAARIILKDYNNGKLVYVHLRPDYNKEKHGEIVQANIDYDFKPSLLHKHKEENESKREETKEEIDEEEEENGEGEVDEDEEEKMENLKEESKDIDQTKTTTVDTNNPEIFEEQKDTVEELNIDEAKINTIEISEKPQTIFINPKEEQFDKEFFGQRKKMKLNKAQKHAMKIAAKKGEDPDSVDLNNPMYQKGKGKRRIGGYGEKEVKKGGNSNKINEFVKMGAN